MNRWALFPYRDSPVFMAHPPFGKGTWIPVHYSRSYTRLQGTRGENLCPFSIFVKSRHFQTIFFGCQNGENFTVFSWNTHLKCPCQSRGKIFLHFAYTTIPSANIEIYSYLLYSPYICTSSGDLVAHPRRAKSKGYGIRSHAWGQICTASSFRRTAPPCIKNQMDFPSIGAGTLG